jgi:hypothetical protein
MNTRYVGTFCTALVVGGALIAGSTTAADSVDVKTPVMGQSNQNPWLIKDNAYFDRYIDKAVKHAAEAELAGMQGHAPELLEHAQESLDQAKQAQRAGTVPGLNEGIVELREALNSTRAGDGSIAACTSRTDVNGTVIYDDPTCPTRNKTATDPTTESIATCTSRTDANGTVIYDDPTCPTRSRKPQGALQSATAHVREARINLSKAGGIKPVEIRTSAR